MKQKLLFTMILLLSIFGVRAQSNCPAPSGLESTVHVPSWYNVQLNWDAVGDILWSSRVQASSIGLNAAADFTGAVRFEPTDLASLPSEMTQLSAVTFIPHELQSVCTYSIRVWQGGSFSNSTFTPGTLLVEQEITDSLQIDELNTITLNTPITVDPTQELWIGIRCNTSAGYPLGVSENNTVENKGDILLLDTNWTTLTVNGLTDYNWIIIGNFSTSDATPSGYNVYRDNVLLNAAPITTLNYSDSVPAGTYTYDVTAVYSNSCESDPVSTTVVMNAYPCDGCSDSVIVGTGTASGHDYPINTYYNYSYTQQIYTAAEIGNAEGGINCIAFQYIHGSTQVKNIAVYLGNTNKSSFESDADWVNTTDMQLVFNGDITFGPGNYNNWVNIPFNTPFEWDGSSNIVVAVLNNTGDYTSGSEATFLYHTTTSNTSMKAQNDSSPYNIENINFTGSSFSNRNNIRFLIGEPISCRMPGRLAASDITFDGATLSWDGNNPDASYEIVVVPAGDDVTSGTPITTADTFYLLTGYSDNTAYDVYVRANCSSGNSNWAIVSFHTRCLDVEQLPLTETFDSYAENAMPDCWLRKSLNASPFVSTEEASSGSKSLFFTENSGVYSCAILPMISTDMYAINTLQLTFKALKQYASYGHIVVGVISDPTDISTFTAVKNIDGTMYDMTNSWQEFTVYFNEYQGPAGHIAFCAPGTYYSNVYIDDVVVEPISGCGTPTDFEVSQVTGTSAFLSWVESELVDETVIYNVEYSEQNYDNWIQATPNGTTCLLTGLQPGTNYDAILYVTCDNGSSDTLSLSFTTGCLAGGGINIGNGTGTNSNIPFNTWYGYTISQQIYTGAELGGPNTLSGIKFHIAAAQYNTRNVDIYLSYTSETSLSNYIPVTAQNKVFSGSINTGTAGWVEVPFDTAFAYAGGNLILTVDDNTGSYSTETPFSTHSISGTNIYAVNDVNNYDPTTPCSEALFTSTNARNNVIFMGECDSVATCVAPNVFVNNLTSSSANLFWAPGYQESEWELEYKPESDSVWISEGSITQTSYTLTNLLSGTRYEVRLRSVCDAGEYSNYIVHTFETPCAYISTLPFAETFDSVAVNTIPDCWYKLGTATYGNYPFVDDSQSVLAGGNSVYMYNGGSSSYSILTTPRFADEIEIDSLLVSFYIYGSWGTDYTLEVGVMTDPTDAATFTTIASCHPVMENVWERQEIFTRNYTGNGHHIAFRTPVGSYNEIYLDDISIIAIPSCVHTENLVVTNVDTTSATFTWSPGGAETAWDVVVLPSGNVDWDTVTNINTVYACTHTEYNLQSSTRYTVYVRANCDGGEASEWESIEFMTTQIPSQLPYFCDFEEANPGWGFYNVPNTNQWYIGTAANNGGAKSMYISNNNGTTNSYGAVTSNNWAYRDIYFPASTNGYVISFDWRANGEGGYYNYDYMNAFIGDVVDINATTCLHYDEGPAGTVKLNATAMVQQSAFTNFSYTLPGYATGGIKRLYFAWRNDSSVQNDPAGAVDNIMISEITCPIPSDLAATNVTATTVDLSWTENGTATEWAVYHKSVADTSWTETIVYTTTHQLTGLTPDLSYSVRVAADCGNGTDMSPFSNTVSFTTLPSCPAPSNLTSTGNTSTTADLSWTAGGSETAWTIAYKTESDDWSNATEVNASATTYTLTGLTASTSYLIRVKAVCDVNDESSWSNIITVIPGSMSMPATGTATISTCGTIIYDNGGSTGDYAVNSNSTLTINPENPGEFVVISGNFSIEEGYDYLYVYDGTDITGTLLNTYSGSGTILDTSATGSLTLHFTSDDMYQYSGFNVTVSCSPVGAGGNGGGGDTEPCNAPTNVTAVPGTTTADISWTAGGSEDAWIVEYKLATASNWSSSPTLSTTTYDITGLTPSSNYQVRVKAICSSDNESDWSNMATFTTLNEDVATYTITATATGPGTIAPNGTVTVQEGSDVTFTFTADDGAIVSQLLVDDAETAIPSNNEYTFSAVVANHTIAVTFEEEGDDTGIEEINLDNAVVLFPNPATSHIEIRVQDGALTNASLEIFDVYGRKVATQTMNNNAIQVDISGYAAGMYLARISNENGVVVKNFIKK